MAGVSTEEAGRGGGSLRMVVAGHGLMFVLGLTTIFALLGASATLIGRALLENQGVMLKVAGLVVILFGLHTLGVIRIPWLYRTARVTDIGSRPNRGFHGSFLLGAAFGAGWTPCIGPFLASILFLASSENTVGQGTLLLVVYALGLGLPFLGASLALQRGLAVTRALKTRMLLIERISGVVLLGMGVLLFSERFTLLTAWLTRIFGTGLAI
jgi:cytochrome c-type biogenesis protein